MTSSEPALLAAVIGAGSALLVTVVTLHFSQANTRMQLEHEENQKSKERLYNLKKEIYIGAIESYGIFIGSVLDTTEIKSKSIINFNISITKIEMVCDHTIMEYTSRIRSLILTMTREIPSIDYNRNEHEKIVDEIMREIRSNTRKAEIISLRTNKDFSGGGSNIKDFAEDIRLLSLSSKEIRKAMKEELTKQIVKLRNASSTYMFISEKIEPVVTEMFMLLREDLGARTSRQDIEAALAYRHHHCEIEKEHLADIVSQLEKLEQLLAQLNVSSVLTLTLGSQISRHREQLARVHFSQE